MARGFNAEVVLGNWYGEENVVGCGGVWGVEKHLNCLNLWWGMSGVGDFFFADKCR